MVCPECNGRGETVYYVETDRDENTVTMEQRKGICQTCNGSGEKAQTNADRIKSMGNDDMARTLYACPWCHHHCEHTGEGECLDCIVRYLQQPAEGADNG